MDSHEALDYLGAEPATLIGIPDEHNDNLQQKLKRRIWGYSGRTASKLGATLLAGAGIGLAAVCMQSLIEVGVGTHNQLLQQVFGTGLMRAFYVEVFISASLVLAAGGMVLLFAPKAAGGGVAPVMAALNGNDLPGLLGLDVLAVKLLGACMSRVATLAVGVEGPMVHVGACIASTACRVEQRLWEWAQRRAQAKALARQSSLGYDILPAADPDQQQVVAVAAAAAAGAGDILRSEEHEAVEAAKGLADDGEPAEHEAVGNMAAQVDHSFYHREMVSAGVAAGIAGAFGAPIGGVLFSLEEASTHWGRSIAWRSFLCAAVATFVHSQLNPQSDTGILTIHGVPSLTPRQWLAQLPLVVLVSAGAGFLGASLNLLRRVLRKMHALPQSPAQSLGEALAVAGITVAVIAALSAYVGSCQPLPPHWRPDDVVQHLCPAGRYNDLATMFLGSSVFVIRSLIGLNSETQPLPLECHEHNCYFTLPSLLVLCASYLLLTALSSRLVVPGGLFMPSIMIGASFGAAAGIVLHRALPSWDVQPGVMAVIGATAALGGVFHSSISLVAIVIEGTQGMRQAFGIIMAVVISNYVCHLCGTDSVYIDDVESIANVSFLHQDPPRSLRHLTAINLMAAPVIGFDALVSVSTVKSVLRRSKHNAFPVYTVRDPVTGLGRLDGIILRSQLQVLLKHRAFCDAQGRYLHIHPAAGPQLEQQLSLLMQERTRRSSSGRLLLVFEGRGSGSSGSENPSLLHSPHRSPSLAPVGEDEEPAEVVPNSPVGSPATVLPDTKSLMSSLATADALPSPGRRVHWQSFADAQQPSSAWQLQEGTPTTGPLMPVKQQQQQQHAHCSAEEHDGPYLHLTPFMNRAPMSVRRFTPATRVHQLFLSLSLRHLCVIDRSNAAVGIITRKDLVRAAQKTD